MNYYYEAHETEYLEEQELLAALAEVEAFEERENLSER